MSSNSNSARATGYTRWRLPMLGVCWMIAANVVAQPTDAGSMPSIGLFGLGMSLDEIKAAAPQVKWRDDRLAAFSRRVTAISSLETITIAGMAFHVQAQVPYYQHGLRLDSASHAATATACEQSVLAWLSKVESQLGPLQSLPRREIPAGPNSLQWNVQRNAAGSINLTPTMNFGSPGRMEGDIVKFGQQSSVLVEAFDDLYKSRSRNGFFGGEPEHLKLSASNQGRSHRVDVKAEFREASNPNCTTELAMERWTQPPTPRVFVADDAKLISKPSIAERHWAWTSFAKAPPLAEAVNVELRCMIETTFGKTRGCGVVAPDVLNGHHVAIATRMANGLSYDLQGVDRDDPQNMQTTITVRLDPMDRKPIDFLDEPRTPQSELIWEEQPNAEDFYRAYPIGLTGTPDEIAVTLTCRVQSDGSLVCGDARLAEISNRQEFIFAATRLSALDYRAAPKLRDGTSSTGRVVQLVITLRRVDSNKP